MPVEPAGPVLGGLLAKLVENYCDGFTLRVAGEYLAEAGDPTLGELVQACVRLSHADAAGATDAGAAAAALVGRVPHVTRSLAARDATLIPDLAWWRLRCPAVAPDRYWLWRRAELLTGVVGRPHGAPVPPPEPVDPCAVPRPVAELFVLTRALAWLHPCYEPARGVLATSYEHAVRLQLEDRAEAAVGRVARRAAAFEDEIPDADPAGDYNSPAELRRRLTRDVEEALLELEWLRGVAPERLYVQNARMELEALVDVLTTHRLRPDLRRRLRAAYKLFFPDVR